MNMDEAMSIFSAETLSSMQMASMYGSGGPWVAIAKGIGTIVAGWAIGEVLDAGKAWVMEKLSDAQKFFESLDNDPTAPSWEPGAVISIGDSITFTISGSADSAIMKLKDGHEFKIYGLNNGTPN